MQVDWRGVAGILATKTGERGEAQRHLRWLENSELPHAPGLTVTWRAAIAAHLGEKEEAVALLRGAFEIPGPGWGYPRIWSIHNGRFYLDPLRGYPPFEELVRPKG